MFTTLEERANALDNHLNKMGEKMVELARMTVSLLSKLSAFLVKTRFAVLDEFAMRYAYIGAYAFFTSRHCEN